MKVFFNFFCILRKISNLANLAKKIKKGRQYCCSSSNESQRRQNRQSYNKHIANSSQRRKIENARAHQHKDEHQKAQKHKRYQNFILHIFNVYYFLTFNTAKIRTFVLTANYFERIFQKCLLKIENQQFSKVDFYETKQNK